MKTKTMQAADIFCVLQSWIPVRIKLNNFFAAKKWCKDRCGEQPFCGLRIRYENNILSIADGLDESITYSDSEWDHSGYDFEGGDARFFFFKNDITAVEFKLRFG